MKATVSGTRMRREAMQALSLQASYMCNLCGWTQGSRRGVLRTDEPCGCLEA